MIGRRRQLDLRHAADCRRSGFMSIAVMTIIVLITLACYRFSTDAVLTHRAEATRADRVQLNCCAESAEAYLLARLSTAAKPESMRSRGDLSEDAGYFAMPVGGFADSARRSHFTVIGRAVDAEGQHRLQYGPTREAAKISLWAIARWEEEKPGRGLAALSALPGIDMTMAERLVDFLTGRSRYPDSRRVPLSPDSAPPARPISEDSIDGSLLGTDPTDPEVAAKLFPGRRWQGATLDELLLVEGMSPSLLTGGDRNANGWVSPSELEAVAQIALTGPQGSAGEVGGAPLENLLCVYSAERNVNRAGEPRIYVNDANLDRLERELTARLPRGWGEFILAYRRHGPVEGTTAPYATASDSRQSAISSESTDLAASQAEGATDTATDAETLVAIRSLFDLIGAEVSNPQGNGNGRLANPFAADRAAYREYLPKLLDELTVDPHPTIPGRININEAPRVVLQAIPGVDGELVERILSARGDARTEAAGRRDHPAWLVAEGWVDISWLQQLEPYITCGGDVYRAQIVSFFAPGMDYREPQRRGAYDGFVRREVVLDIAHPRPRVLVRRDLSSLGRGYRAEALGL